MSDWKNVQYKDGKMRTSEGGGGGGGASNFADLDDVSFSNLQNGQVAKYNSTTQKWENANESGGGHTYSTAEQDTGDIWIDGKHIYEKAFNYSGRLANGNYAVLDSSLLRDDVDLFFAPVVSVSILGAQNVFGNSAVGNGVLNVGIHPSLGVFIENYTGNTVTNTYIVIRYTKTTD